MSIPPGRRPRISPNVIVLGFVSLFTDVASEMLYPVIPLFLVGTLGATPAILGFIDGLAEGGTSILRWLVGAISDRFRRRKPFVVIGYSLSALSKPLMGLAAYFGGWPMVLLGRSTDRLGKSIRTSARDALIADSTAPERRGAAFGLHRAMDTTGAVAGPLVTLAIILAWKNLPLQWLFFAALVPGIFSALLAVGMVKDIPHEANPEAKPPSIWQSYSKELWWLVAASGVFALGNSSDAFLILRASELGLSFAQVVLAFAIYNAIFALGAFPLGDLSDRIGRKPVIVIGWIIYAAVYAGFAMAKSPGAVWGLLAVYGLYQAFTDGVTKAWISDVAGKSQRAGAMGLFYTVTGAAQFAASLATGWLWHVRIHGNINAGLAIGAIFAAAAIPVVITVHAEKTS